MVVFASVSTFQLFALWPKMTIAYTLQKSPCYVERNVDERCMLLLSGVVVT